MELESNGVLARCFMRQRGRRIGVARSPLSASTPADRSKRATQLSPGAALPALCLLVPGRFGFAVHGMGYLVYDDKDYDENGQEKGTYFGAVWCMGYGGRYVLRC